MNLERRNNERSSSNTPAVIRSDDASFTASCVVHNLSEGGARLLVEDWKALPQRFILFLIPNSFIGRRCETIWRIGNKVGVRFVSIVDCSVFAHHSDVWAPE
jgi:hypothetical protein